MKRSPHPAPAPPAPRSVKRTILLVFLGLLLVAAVLLAIRIYRVVTTPYVYEERQTPVSAATNTVPFLIQTNPAAPAAPRPCRNPEISKNESHQTTNNQSKLVSMKDNQRLIANPSVAAAVITASVSLIIAVFSCFWALHSSKAALKLESDRLLGFHKLEIFENAIAEINYLVPLYNRLRNDAFEKRTELEIKPVLSLLKQEINAIIEYQKQHNAIEKAKIYSSSLAKCIPFAANQACVNYKCKLDSIEQNGRFNSKFSMDGDDGVSVDMYLVDALSEYELCVEQLKKEIEDLEWFRR